MGHKVRRAKKKQPKGQRSPGARKRSYSATEIFTAIIGALVIVLFAGLIITSCVGG
jgi:hypothetical protein